MLVPDINPKYTAVCRVFRHVGAPVDRSFRTLEQIVAQRCAVQQPAAVRSNVCRVRIACRKDRRLRPRSPVRAAEHCNYGTISLFATLRSSMSTDSTPKPAFPVTDEVRHALAVTKRGVDELLIEEEFRAEARKKRSYRHAAAHQAGPRPDGARHPHRHTVGAEQDAPAAGPGPYGDFPDRRLYVADRRSVGPQRDASAAHARTDRIEREDLLRPGRARARPRKNRNPLQQRMVDAARRRRP